MISCGVDAYVIDNATLMKYVIACMIVAVPLSEFTSETSCCCIEEIALYGKEA